MVKIFSYFNIFLKYLKDFGVLCTFKLVLKRLGFKNLDAYHKIKFPFLDWNLRVKYRGYYWKRVENCQHPCEPLCLTYLKEKIKKGQTIIDAGVSNGQFLFFFSKLVGEEGKIIGFEPDPYAFSDVTKSKKKNNLKNITIEPMALGNQIGKDFLILRGGGGLGTSSFSLHKQKALAPKIEVPITTLDQYCKSKSLIPSGIKIDVEGAEALVIDGCREIIKNYHPWVLLEFHGTHFPEDSIPGIWNKIIDLSKKIIFIKGEQKSNKYVYGMEVKEMPESTYFHVFIQY